VSDYESIIKLADGFNGADLRNICTEAGAPPPERLPAPCAPHPCAHGSWSVRRVPGRTELNAMIKPLSATPCGG
jgi:hypothetical protein